MLGTTGDLGTNARLFEQGTQPVHELLDEGLPIRTLLRHQPADALVGVGLQITKSQVLELPLELPDTQPIGEGSMNHLRLAGDLAPRGLIGVAGNVQARDLPGQCDEDDTNIGHQGHQQLPQSFSARLIVGEVGAAKKCQGA